MVESCSAIVEALAAGGVRYRCALITLTYGAARPEPRDITRAMDAMESWCRRRRYWVKRCWRFEYGSLKGRPHYHVLVFLPSKVRLPLFDKRGWWKKGMSNAVWARNPVGYIAKYCSKASCGAQDWEVKGMRWCGYGGVTSALRLSVRWRCAPGWVREFRDRIDGDEKTALRRSGTRWCVGPWRLKSPWSCRELAGAMLEFFWRGYSDESVEFVG